MYKKEKGHFYTVLGGNEISNARICNIFTLVQS